MKRILLLAGLLALALPTAAFASSTIDYSNSGGTLTASTSGLSTTLTLSGSALTDDHATSRAAWSQATWVALAFTTGALTSGSLDQGGTFAAGGTFTITGNGEWRSTVMFTGTFSTPLTLTLVTNSDGTHNYILWGSVSGMTGSGLQTVGTTSS